MSNLPLSPLYMQQP